MFQGLIGRVCVIILIIGIGLQIGGSGGLKADSFYKISSVQDLNRIRSNLGGYFVLVRDVDLSGVNFRSIGTESDPFQGTLEGGGKVISGLTVIRSNGEGVGLFGHIGKKGFVKNLRLKGVKVEGRKYVGGLAGRNEGPIQNSHVTGEVMGVEYVGGLVGSNAGLVQGSEMVGKVFGARRVGGLFGYNQGNIRNCYSEVRVMGKEKVGGLIGSNIDGDGGGGVWGSHFKGQVGGKKHIGGLIGWNMNMMARESTLRGNCYSEGEVFGEVWVGDLIGWDLKRDGVKGGM